MWAIRELRRLGFEFSVIRKQGSDGTEKTRINYRFVGEKRPPEKVTAPLFAALKRQKREAVAYLEGPHFRKKEYVEPENMWEEARLMLERFGFFLLESDALDDTIAVLADGKEREDIQALNESFLKDIPCYTAQEVRLLWDKRQQGLDEDGLRRLHEAKRMFDGRVVR
jgi:hypothetical protein